MSAAAVLKAPFPYFGGKARAAPLVWERFGVVNSYVEPFFGSGAVLFRRPTPFNGVETVNDADGLVANFWRATQSDPEQVARYVDAPVNENDLHAKHAWLVGQKNSLQSRLEGDPDYFDPKIAGWWAWGLSCWIGSGFCSGNGPWHVIDGELVNVKDGDAGRGVNRKRPHLGNAGRGVNRKRPHLGNAGQGVNRQRPHLGDAGRGVNRKRPESDLCAYFAALADRLRRVRVCCGDWSRVMGDAPMFPVARHGSSVAGVFLDPPYADTAKRNADLYRVESLTVAHQVREWAIEHGDDPRYRICLAGYDGEHVMPDDWTCVEGRSGRGHGYGGQSKDGYANKGRERLWFSPHCLDDRSHEPTLTFRSDT